MATLVTPEEVRRAVLSELAAAERKEVYIIARELSDTIKPVSLVIGIIALTSVTRGMIESVPDYYGFTELVIKDIVADLIRTPRNNQRLH